MSSPYSKLGSRSFWKSAVAERHPLDPGDIYRPKFLISPKAKILTAGSCFAQHVGRRLRLAGLNVIDAEPLPEDIPDSIASEFGYRMYSARYGNIYTVRQLLQLHKEAYGDFTPSQPVWERDGRFYDSLRPGVEPAGLESDKLVVQHRSSHIESVRRTFEEATLIVFTFGLTETWIHAKSGTVYPTAPGTIAGQYDPRIYEFKNFTAQEVISDFREFRRRIKSKKKRTRFIITVSPVPLTATATNHHVEIATSYSKSVLRAACGQLAEQFLDVDYFPSYEIITSINSRGVYFEANKRSVSSLGVDTAMNYFLSSHHINPISADKTVANNMTDGKSALAKRTFTEDVVCEDMLLEAFGK